MNAVRFIVFCLCFWTCMSLYAVPANPMPFSVRQPDGTHITLTLRGDEHFHCYATTDNIPVVEDDGAYYYAQISNDGLIKSSGLLAHNYRQRSQKESILCSSEKEAFWIATHSYWQSKLENANKMRLARNLNRRAAPTSSFIGNKKGLVILVEFANLEMATEDAHTAFEEQFNQKGYSKNGHIGSVRDYFYDQSYGQFDLTFDVVGPVKVSRNYGYYGSNSSRGGDKYPGTMISEACKLADQLVNFADYDWNHDGEVDQVYVIYAGYGESNGAVPSNTIWPHEYNLASCQYSGDGDGPITLDGVTINTYACSCELRGSYGTKMNGIGTACHEFSHCLGFPDMYDTGYNGAFGMNCWDLMDSGSYNGPEGCGEVPCGYSAYERETAGWLQPIELTSTCIVSDMPCIADTPVAYKICNNGHSDEYFLLENRQNRGWFSFAKTFQSAHGLLITHVDYNEAAWAINKVNTSKTHQRMTIVPADNSYGTSYKSDDGQVYILTTEHELAGDMFPGAAHVTEFTNISHQQTGGLLFNANDDGTYHLNKPIENITEEEGLISFYFMGGIYIEAPQILNISDITSDAFTVTWNTSTDADRYALELTESGTVYSPLHNVVLNENFYKFKAAGVYDGFQDVAEHLDDYTIQTGWSGYKIFTSPKGVKLGTSNADGHINTPLFQTPEGQLTLFIPASSYELEGTIITELVNEVGTTLFTEERNITNTEDTVIIHTPYLPSGSYKLRVASSNRIYVANIGIYSGMFSKDDFQSIESSLRPADRRFIDNIHNTSYRFTDLTAKKYQLRIRAYKDLAHSEWSNYQEIHLDSPQSIIAGKNDVSVPHRLYRLNGMAARNRNRNGIYILSNGRKTILRQ